MIMHPALFLAVSVFSMGEPGQAVLQPPVQQTPMQQTAQQDPPPSPQDELAFATDETRMTVPVTIGGAGPYRFIVDTGSERTVVSREVATTLSLTPGPMVRVTAMAGTVPVPTVAVPQIVVGTPRAGASLTATRIEAPVLFAHNLGAAGLVGIDTLQGKAVEIDFARDVMTVFPATRRTRRETFGPDDIVIRAKNVLGQLVVTDAVYDGRRIRVVIDTGSVVSMGNIALQRLVGRSSGSLIAVRLLSVTGAMLDAQYGIVTGVHVGEIGLANLPIAFSDAAPFRRLGLADRPALLLGMDALRLFGRVRIDFANRELHLARPRAAAVPGIP
ncbi:retropepsin-like aspartic protease [Sphingomonas sp. PAMC 26621]|uniref:retropepsin-like aspartic protease n=1 Tax=Sphingomonas sp. PAMC 26621 TaxID=1112213 RepID=UPI000289EBBC|nr:retropepsin-like aspartic protease [Sphingomonas sp. PAMC 26621]